MTAKHQTTIQAALTAAAEVAYGGAGSPKSMDDVWPADMSPDFCTYEQEWTEIARATLLAFLRGVGPEATAGDLAAALEAANGKL